MISPESPPPPCVDLTANDRRYQKRGEHASLTLPALHRRPANRTGAESSPTLTLHPIGPRVFTIERGPLRAYARHKNYAHPFSSSLLRPGQRSPECTIGRLRVSINAQFINRDNSIQGSYWSVAIVSISTVWRWRRGGEPRAVSPARREQRRGRARKSESEGFIYLVERVHFDSGVGPT